jgi:hypothetical protein
MTFASSSPISPVHGVSPPAAPKKAPISSGGGQASGRHNCNLGEDQQQNSQPLRNAKQANSGPYRSDHDCIISQRNRCVGFLSYQHHSAPCPSNNHGDPHDSDHYGKDASKHGSPKLDADSHPGDSVAAVYAIAADCAKRQVLGPDVAIDIEAIDETNTRVDVASLVARLRRHRNFGLVALVGVLVSFFTAGLPRSHLIPRVVHLNAPRTRFRVPPALPELPSS